MFNRLLAALLLTCVSMPMHAAPPSPTCIAGARPGGGFEATCKLVQAGVAQSGLSSAPMRIEYVPGGIGSVAYNTVVGQRADEAGTLVAFSSGSLLNIALGRFGRFPPEKVRWVAAVGTDYGAVIVRADARHATLRELLQAIGREPQAFLCGGSGNAGSQDWMKCALLARKAGVEPARLRYVAFEGGGQALTALQAGYVQIVPGDVSEAVPLMRRGAARVLAVMAPQRLPGEMAGVPTAREQGFELDWIIYRGVYMGPQVAEADHAWWTAAFDRMLAQPGFERLRRDSGMYPLALTGAALRQRVLDDIRRYRELAREFGLQVPSDRPE